MMQMFRIYNEDNQSVPSYIADGSVDLIYADMLFDCYDFDWIDICYRALRSNGSIFLHTDQRSVAEVKLYADMVFSGPPINWIIWPYDWGGRSNRYFGKKHDDILWYAKGKDYKFYPDRVMIPKKTAKSNGLNPSGRLNKIPTDVWDDIGNFHTMDSERVKWGNGTNVKWQKPMRLIERIVLATTDEGDLVVDPFLGTGTTAQVCADLGRRFIGFENDPAIYKIAMNRLATAIQQQEELWHIQQ